MNRMDRISAYIDSVTIALVSESTSKFPDVLI